MAAVVKNAQKSNRRWQLIKQSPQRNHLTRSLLINWFALKQRSRVFLSVAPSIPGANPPPPLPIFHHIAATIIFLRVSATSKKFGGVARDIKVKKSVACMACHVASSFTPRVKFTLRGEAWLGAQLAPGSVRHVEVYISSTYPLLFQCAYSLMYYAYVKHVNRVQCNVCYQLVHTVFEELKRFVLLLVTKN